MTLSCACRRCRMMQVRGKVTFNGQVLSKRLKRQIGYVMQVRHCGVRCARLERNRI